MLALVAGLAAGAELAPAPLRTLQVYQLWVSADAGFAIGDDPTVPPGGAGALEHGARVVARGGVEVSAGWWGTEEVVLEPATFGFRETLDLVLAAPQGPHPGAALTATVGDGPTWSVALSGRLRAGDANRAVEARLGPVLLGTADPFVPGVRGEVEAGAALGPRLRLGLGLEAEVGDPEAPWARTRGTVGVRAWPGRRWELSGVIGGGVASAGAPNASWAWAQGAATWWSGTTVGLSARLGAAADEAGIGSWAMLGVQLRFDRHHANAAPDRHRFRVRPPAATEVAVMGSFTGWQRVPLHRAADGAWETTLTLDPGWNTYVYVVDGKVLVPPDADRLEPDGYGGVNGVLRGPELTDR